ncbi:MAG: SRPBCC family protein [Acidimicrobiia bacterium]
MSSFTESVERVIAAPPDAIFDLLADPTRHREIDGSGEVRDAKQGSQRLALGDTFGMAMNAGFNYSMVSTVIELDENRRIAWQTRPPGFLAHLLGGRIWRYELEPVDGGTRVRETWDLSEEKGKSIVWRGRHSKAVASMQGTLERIEEVVTR